MKRALSAPVSVLLLALGLTACGSGTGQPSPSATPTPSTSATATATPSPTPSAVYKPATATSKAKNVPVPVMPEAAKAQTPDGAKAFVGYWFSALSYGYETGETKAVKENSGPDCQICGIAPETIRKVYADGWLVGGKLRVPTIEVRSTPSNEKVILVAQVIQGTSHVQKAASAGKQLEETNEALACEVVWTNGHWILSTAMKITS